ncbi:transposase [Microcoleus sp. ZQ-A2]
MHDKHQIIEEPCEVKVSRTVLKTSGAGDSLVEFNSRCGHIHPEKSKSYRNGKKFKCGHCGFEHDADVNAALNIAALGICASNPESPGMSCQLEGQLFLFPISQI